MMTYAGLVNEYTKALNEVLLQIDGREIEPIVMKLNETMRNGNHIYVFGNGGCSAHAAHFCADLGKMMKLEKNENYRITSLNDNMPSITAWANDTGYENIFWRQLELYMMTGDVAFAMSGSGKSANVIKAIQYAKDRGNHTIGLSGFGGGQLAQLADTGYVVPSHNMQIVEDAFGVILHTIFVALRDS